MKKSAYLYVCIVVIIFCGCVGHRYPQSLVVADSLVSDDPDSALAILHQMEPEIRSASESVQRYYQLLRIKADDKVDKMYVSPDSIKDLVRYYEEDGDQSMLPTAYYYAGRVYSDLNEAPVSLSYFQKSLEVMDDRGDNNLYLKSVIFSQMGYLYLFQYLYDEAEQCFQASYEIGLEVNDTASIFWGLRDIGATYHWQKNYSECLHYYNKAREIAIKANDIKLKANIFTDFAYLYNSMGNYADARKYMQMSQKHINLLDSNTVLTSALSIYYNTNEVDSFLQTARILEQMGDVFLKRKYMIS